MDHPVDTAVAAQLMSGVPSWGVHGPAAFDLAVTCGLRQDKLQQPQPMVAVLPQPTRTGRTSTSTLCPLAQLKGFNFCHCSGGRGPIATKTWKELAAAIAARSNESVATETERLLQTLAVALQRENARAVLRRFGE